jgi:hypothetical protein
MQILWWCDSLFVGMLTSLPHWSREGGKNGVALIVRTIDMPAVVTPGGVRVLVLGECTCLAIIMRQMMVVVAPTAQASPRMGMRA